MPDFLCSLISLIIYNNYHSRLLEAVAKKSWGNMFFEGVFITDKGANFGIDFRVLANEACDTYDEYILAGLSNLFLSSLASLTLSAKVLVAVDKRFLPLSLSSFCACLAFFLLNVRLNSYVVSCLLAGCLISSLIENKLF